MQVKKLSLLGALVWSAAANLSIAQTPVKPAAPEPRPKLVSQQASAQAAFSEGFELLKAGRHSEAVLRFESGLKLEPKNATAWFYLGEARLRMGADIAAANAYKKSLELDANGQVSEAARARVAELGRGSDVAAMGSTAKNQGKTKEKFGFVSPRHRIPPGEATIEP
jgi:tetratricopeptide (TPR) repeat protein